MRNRLYSKSPVARPLALAVALAALSGCSTLPGSPDAGDPRWADYRNWTKVTGIEPSTGNPTGFLGGVHRGDEGYRDVYVNAVARNMLLGTAPYNFPAGSVIVKEQFANREDWEQGVNAEHTISVKAVSSDELSSDNWLWADSYKGKAVRSEFCSGCHTLAARSDFVFTTGDFVRSLY